MQLDNRPFGRTHASVVYFALANNMHSERWILADEQKQWSLACTQYDLEMYQRNMRTALILTSFLSFFISVVSSSHCWEYCHFAVFSLSTICSKCRCFCSSSSFCSRSLLKLYKKIWIQYDILRLFHFTH